MQHNELMNQYFLTWTGSMLNIYHQFRPLCLKCGGTHQQAPHESSLENKMRIEFLLLVSIFVIQLYELTFK